MSRALFDEIENWAILFRQQYGLSLFEPIRIKSLLQKLDVLTVYKDMSVGISGMAIKIEGVKSTNRFLLVNSSHPIGRQHFTICHELYHLFIQSNFKHGVSCASGSFDSKDKEEYRADLFASSLLLPRYGIESMIPKHEKGKRLSIETLIKIEQFFGASHKALLNRLVFLGYITKELKEEYSKVSIKREALKNGYDISLYEPGNSNVSIGNYGPLAFAALEQGIISKSKYESLLLDLNININAISDSLIDEEC